MRKLKSGYFSLFSLLLHHCGVLPILRKKMLRFTALVFFIFLSSFLHAQQRIEPGQMHYLITTKPNNILYRDTLYRGSKEFMQLFYRTRDQQLIDLYLKHQSNKVSGQVLGVVGSLATIFGISRISSADQKGAGWALLGGGFASMITSGYLLLQGQKNLALAVTLFNQRYNKTALQLGISQQQAGIVFKF